MILECPSCRRRYKAPIGLFAQGGRRVRCAYCKYEWHEKLPTSVEVNFPAVNIPSFLEEPHKSADPSLPHKPLWIRKRNLLMKNGNKFPAFPGMERFSPQALKAAGLGLLAMMTSLFLVIWIFGGEASAPPPEHEEWKGLFFDEVKSELRYDGGTMKLFVDGLVGNSAEETKELPDIRARALGVDRREVQKWLVERPARTIKSGERIPFHTEVATPMERTIDDVHLEFTPRKEKGNAHD